MSDGFNSTVLAILAAVQDSQVSLHRLAVGIDTKVAGLDSKVTALDSKVTALDSKVTALDSKVTALEAEIASVRTGIMERIDRLQHKVDGFEEHLLLGLGNAVQTESRFDAAAKENRIIGEQIRSVQKLLLMLEGRVSTLEERR